MVGGGDKVKKGEQIKVEGGGIYELQNDVTVGTTVPKIVACGGRERHCSKGCSPLCSEIVLQDCSVLQNGGCGLNKNGSKGVKVWGLKKAFNRRNHE